MWKCVCSHWRTCADTCSEHFVCNLIQFEQSHVLICIHYIGARVLCVRFYQMATSTNRKKSVFIVVNDLMHFKFGYFNKHTEKSYAHCLAFFFALFKLKSIILVQNKRIILFIATIFFSIITSSVNFFIELSSNSISSSLILNFDGEMGEASEESCFLAKGIEMSLD